MHFLIFLIFCAWFVIWVADVIRQNVGQINGQRLQTR